MSVLIVALLPRPIVLLCVDTPDERPTHGVRAQFCSSQIFPLKAELLEREGKRLLRASTAIRSGEAVPGAIYFPTSATGIGAAAGILPFSPDASRRAGFTSWCGRERRVLDTTFSLKFRLH